MTHHKITFCETQLVCKAFFCSILCCSFDLIIIVVQADNIGAGKLCYFSSRSSYTASDIQDLRTFSHTHHVGKIMLVSGNGLVEAFSISESTEVEGSTPAVFIKIGCEVVVMSGERGVFCFSSLEALSTQLLVLGKFHVYLSDLSGFGPGCLVIPMLEIFS